MITINYITINNDRTSMDVSITTEVGQLFESVRLWTDATFKDYSVAKDFSSKLLKTSENEVFSITAVDLGLAQFDGLYFLEFEDNATTPYLVLGIAADLTTYKQCMLDQVLALTNSSVDLYTGEGCESPEVDNIININMMLEAISVSIQSGFYGESLDFLNALKKLCVGNCAECPNYVSSLTFGVIDNNNVII